jgi:type IV pilus assembly protein PilO
MPNISDMPGSMQWLAMLALAAVLSGGAFFGVFRGQKKQNAAAEEQLKAKIAENSELESYRPRLVQIDQQIASLQQQLAIQERIVPEQKQADDFIRMLQGEAAKSGVEIRRYTTRAVSNREFYTEVPFELELDGPYYSVLNFYDRVAHLERIINISDLQLGSVRKPGDMKLKHTYQYAPGESVLATCVATTFYSHDLMPAASVKLASAKGKK